MRRWLPIAFVIGAVGAGFAVYLRSARGRRSHFFRRLYTVCGCLLALSLVAVPIAGALTFTQNGATVQVATVQNLRSWHIDVHYSNTTETPIPHAGGANFYNDYNVATGTVSHSVVMPEQYRRMRFDVTSVVPTVTYSPVDVTMSWPEFWMDASAYNVAFDLKRNGVSQWGIHQGAGSHAVQANDVLWMVDASSGFASGATYTIPYNGTVTLSVNNATIPHGDWDGGYPYWAGSNSTWVDYTRGDSARIDDSGAGEFENPDWLGFDPPTAVISLSPTSGVAPLEVQYSGALSSDPNGGTLTYLWDFGDGSPSSETSVGVHEYEAAGSYTVTLIVTDQQSDTASATADVVVSADTTPAVEPTGTIITVDPWSTAGLPDGWQIILVALIVGGLGWAWGRSFAHE